MVLSKTLDRVRRSVSKNYQGIGHPLDRILARQSSVRLEEANALLTSSNRPSVITRTSTPICGNSPHRGNPLTHNQTPPTSPPLSQLLEKFVSETELHNNSGPLFAEEEEEDEVFTSSLSPITGVSTSSSPLLEFLSPFSHLISPSPISCSAPSPQQIVSPQLLSLKVPLSLARSSPGTPLPRPITNMEPSKRWARAI